MGNKFSLSELKHGIKSFKSGKGTPNKQGKIASQGEKSDQSEKGPSQLLGAKAQSMGSHVKAEVLEGKVLEDSVSLASKIKLGASLNTELLVDSLNLLEPPNSLKINVAQTDEFLTIKEILQGLASFKNGGLWGLCVKLDEILPVSVDLTSLGSLVTSRIETSRDSRKLTWWAGRRALVGVTMVLRSCSWDEALTYLAQNLVIGEYGKPYLKSGLFHFSISHSASRLFLLVSKYPCAIDIELVQRRKSYQAVVERMLSPKEQAFVRHSNFDASWILSAPLLKSLQNRLLASQDKNLEAKLFESANYTQEQICHNDAKQQSLVPELLRFFMLWTIKETAVKLTARGLVGLPEFTFKLDEDLIEHQSERGFIQSTVIASTKETFGLSWYMPKLNTKVVWHDFAPISLALTKRSAPVVAKTLALKAPKA